MQDKRWIWIVVAVVVHPDDATLAQGIPGAVPGELPGKHTAGQPDRAESGWNFVAGFDDLGF